MLIDEQVFLNQLPSLEEVLLLERAQKARSENVNPKTSVSIEHIRKSFLKKHVATIKVLALRNDATNDWDLDDKTARLLCKRANSLEELGAYFNISVMHTILQLLPGLASLRGKSSPILLLPRV